MSPDPGEKFFPEYWQYEQAVEQSRVDEAEGAARNLRRAEEVKDDNKLIANVSAAIEYRAPFAIHDETTLPELKARAAIGRSAAALAALEKRQFRCIVGTNSCASIGYQNSCCPEGETCFQIQDTGLGPVGCCPNGRACSGTINSCNAPNTACSSELGGGCCIPGFACQGVGCKSYLYSLGWGRKLMRDRCRECYHYCSRYSDSIIHVYNTDFKLYQPTSHLVFHHNNHVVKHTTCYSANSDMPVRQQPMSSFFRWGMLPHRSRLRILRNLCLPTRLLPSNNIHSSPNHHHDRWRSYPPNIRAPTRVNTNRQLPCILLRLPSPLRRRLLPNRTRLPSHFLSTNAIYYYH